MEQLQTHIEGLRCLVTGVTNTAAHVHLWFYLFYTSAWSWWGWQTHPPLMEHHLVQTRLTWQLCDVKFVGLKTENNVCTCQFRQKTSKRLQCVCVSFEDLQVFGQESFQAVSRYERTNPSVMLKPRLAVYLTSLRSHRLLVVAYVTTYLICYAQLWLWLRQSTWTTGEMDREWRC